MHQVTLEEAGPRLPELIQEAQAGEEVVITQDSAALVKLVPIKPRRKLGTATGQVWMAEDFDAPLEDFKDYM